MTRARDYYEILDVSPQAAPAEIEEAFERARMTYGEDSLATYSLYTPEERADMLRKISEAYETLIDPARKRDYDSTLAGRGLPKARVPREADISLDIAEIVREGHAVGDGYRDVKFNAPLAAMNGFDDAVAEQYRILFTRIEHICAAGSVKCIGITSAVKGEGKTVTALNLGYLIAGEFKKKVLVIECDLRNPTITTRYLAEPGQPGLVDVLNSEASVDEATVRVGSSGLHIIQAHHSVKNSTKLLGDPGLKTVMERCRDEYDYVLIDCPPILNMADVNIISKVLDGLLLVVRAGKTPRDMVQKAVKSVSQNKFIGIALNDSEAPSKKYYY
ncbi:MAG: polysaccharide biosynthesis tyrosine autokinase [Thermodesulfobacteriota bacterium]